MAHRVSAHLFKDFDLNSKLLILHKEICKFKACCNPEHIYEGTHKNNTNDLINTGFKFGEHNKHKTHCFRGH